MLPGSLVGYSSNECTRWRTLSLAIQHPVLPVCASCPGHKWCQATGSPWRLGPSMAAWWPAPRQGCLGLLGAHRTCWAELHAAAAKAPEPKLLRKGGSVRGDCFDQKPCDELRHLMGQLTTHRTQHSQHSKSKVAASYRETLSIAHRHDEI